MRPTAVCQDGFVGVAVYVADDVLCVGRIEFGAQETLRRVAYRDVTRMLVWDDRRGFVRMFGTSVLVAALIVAVLSLNAGNFGFAATAAVAGLIPFGILMFRGRKGGVTRFRLETAHGEVIGVLAGGRDKRDEILWDIEQRVLARQDVGPRTPAPAAVQAISPDDGPAPRPS